MRKVITLQTTLVRNAWNRAAHAVADGSLALIERRGSYGVGVIPIADAVRIVKEIPATPVEHWTAGQAKRSWGKMTRRVMGGTLVFVSHHDVETAAVCPLSMHGIIQGWEGGRHGK